MQQSNETAAKIAEYLLQINAIRLSPNQPFTWTSGWKSPIYSDNRLSLSFPEARTFIKQELGNLVRNHFANAEAIIGVATAGIAPGVLAADELKLPFGYIRSEAKKHGMGKQVEGDIKPGQKVVVVEDLVSTGKSSLQAVQNLKEYGCEVLGIVAIFTYGFDVAANAFANENCPYFALSNYNTLIEVALKQKIVQPEQVAVLNEWRQSPQTWMQQSTIISNSNNE
ncbi:MAG: orotate phosphoribosyltransferase [Bacteroidia bacterium]|jgi:orotate phosphoribosyltransferase|nr:orotate phosphoribosyltransferase [Bacteroidia bacterium]